MTSRAPKRETSVLAIAQLPQPGPAWGTQEPLREPRPGRGLQVSSSAPRASWALSLMVPTAALTPPQAVGELRLMLPGEPRAAEGGVPREGSASDALICWHSARISLPSPSPSQFLSFFEAKAQRSLCLVAQPRLVRGHLSPVPTESPSGPLLHSTVKLLRAAPREQHHQVASVRTPVNTWGRSDATHLGPRGRGRGRGPWVPKGTS